MNEFLEKIALSETIPFFITFANYDAYKVLDIELTTSSGISAICVMNKREVRLLVIEPNTENGKDAIYLYSMNEENLQHYAVTNVSNGANKELITQIRDFAAKSDYTLVEW